MSNRFSTMILAALAATTALGEVKWTYSGTTLTEVVDSGTAWVCTLTAAGGLKKTTVGSSTVLDFRSEAMPAEAPAVTSVADSGFKSCSTLTAVYLPATVTTLGGDSIRECTNLATFEAPGVTSTGTLVFYNDTALKKLSFPALISPGAKICKNCTGIEEFDAPLATSVTEEMFYGCASLRRADFSAATKVLGSGFINCSSLTNLVATNLTTLGVSAFSSCSSLQAIDLSHLTSIGELSLYNCSKLTHLSMPEGLVTLARRCFRDDTQVNTIEWSGYFDYATNAVAVEPFFGWKDLQARLVCSGTNLAARQFFVTPSKFTLWRFVSDSEKSAYFTKYGEDAAVPHGIAVALNNALPRCYVICTGEDPSDPTGVVWPFMDDNVVSSDAALATNGPADRFVYALTNAGTAIVRLKKAMTLKESLIVGGGGSGGGCAGGGGGGGGVQHRVKDVLLPSGSMLYLTAGAGGAGVTGILSGKAGSASTLELPGETLSVYGGGGGGAYASSDAGKAPTGSTLGSGGGGGTSTASQVDGIGYTEGQGQPGGNGLGTGASGGGGGYSERGTDGAADGHSGRGGEGLTNSITGVAVVYGSGGGGGGGKSNHTSFTTTFAAAGGTNAGAGGDGMKGTGETWDGTAVSETTGAGWGDGGGQSAPAGFGGGGGGGGVHKLNGTGTTVQKLSGAGGSGTVILSFTEGGTAGQPAVAKDDIAITFPTAASQPYVRVTLGGAGVYSATVTVSCGTGAVAQAGTHYDHVKTFTSVAREDVVEFLAGFYPRPAETVYVKVTVVAESAEDVAAENTATVPSDKVVPSFVGHGGDPARIIHVRDGATGLADGTSWANAYDDLRTALQQLTAARNELWYAGSNVLTLSALSVQPAAAAVLRGGFSGIEDTAAQRTAGVHSTIDGSLSYYGFDIQSAAAVTVDGFDFIRGNGVSMSGAGSLTVSNCTFDAGRRLFRGVEATGTGAATVRISDCRFANRIITDGNYAYNGNVLISGYARAVVDGCTFVSNGLPFGAKADQQNGRWSNLGIALTAKDTPLTVTRSSFVGNVTPVAYDKGKSEDEGGIVRLEGACGGSAFTNCLFMGNAVVCGVSSGNAEAGYADRNGGVVVVNMEGGAAADLVNCTFAYNTCQACNAAAGLGVFGGTVNVRNSIFAFNSADVFYAGNTPARDIRLSSGATVNVFYSLFDSVGGVVTNAGAAYAESDVLFDDPCFVTPYATFAACLSKGIYTAAGQCTAMSFNVHLCGRAGYTDERTGAWTSTPRGKSPAIDAGDPASDFTGEPQPNGKRINLGYYGNTPYATMTTGPGTVLLIR